MTNPIPAAVTDDRALQDAFKNLPLIPYSSNSAGTGQRLLSFFEDLAKLSVTNNGVIEEKLRHAFGGQIYAEKSRAKIFGEFVYEEVDENILGQYSEILESRVFFEDSYRDTCQRLGHQYLSNGNMAIRAKLQNSDGGRVLILRVVPMQNFLYTNSYLDQGVHAVAIFDRIPTSKKDYEKGIEDGSIEILSKFPHWIQNDDEGYIETFYHFAITDGYYGRPPWEGCWMDAYREFQDRMHLIKEADTEWVGRVIIEVEDPDQPNISSFSDDARDQDAGYSNSAERFAQNFTREGENPQSFMITNRPGGARPMTVITIPPMSNENFWKEAGIISRDSIILSHGWSRRLMGQEFGSGFSRAAFLEELAIKNVSSVIPFRDQVINFIDQILTQYLEDEGLMELSLLRANFKSPYDDLLESGEGNVIDQPQIEEI